MKSMMYSIKLRTVEAAIAKLKAELADLNSDAATYAALATEYWVLMQAALAA